MLFCSKHSNDFHYFLNSKLIAKALRTLVWILSTSLNSSPAFLPLVLAHTLLTFVFWLFPEHAKCIATSTPRELYLTSSSDWLCSNVTFSENPSLIVQKHTPTQQHHMLSSFLASSFSISLTVTLNYRLLCLLIRCLFSSNPKTSFMGQKTAPSSFTTKSLAPKHCLAHSRNSVKIFFHKWVNVAYPKNKTALLFFDTDNYKLA